MRLWPLALALHLQTSCMIRPVSVSDDHSRGFGFVRRNASREVAAELVKFENLLLDSNFSFEPTVEQYDDSNDWRHVGTVVSRTNAP
jgi:hypothetical protein